MKHPRALLWLLLSLSTLSSQLSTPVPAQPAPVLADPTTGALFRPTTLAGNVTVASGKNLTVNGALTGTPTGGTLDLRNTTLTVGDTTLPNAKNIYFTPYAGNAPWRVFSAPALTPNTDDEVFYLTWNARFDPTTGWLTRDVAGLGGASFQFESHWTDNGTVNTFEWNLDFANPGTGPFTSNRRALAFIHDWDTGASSWKFAAASGSWGLQVDDTGTTVGTALVSNGPLTVTTGSITTTSGVITGNPSGGSGLTLATGDQALPMIFKLASTEVARFQSNVESTGALLLGGASDIGGNTRLQLATTGGGIRVDSGSASSGTYPALLLTSSGGGWGSGFQLSNTGGTGRKWGLYADTTAGLQWTDETAGYAWATNAGGTVGSGSFAINYTLEASAGAGSIKTAGGIYAAKKLIAGSTIASTSTTTGSGIFGGGLGVAGDIYGGGKLVLPAGTTSTNSLAFGTDVFLHRGASKRITISTDGGTNLQLTGGANATKTIYLDGYANGASHSMQAASAGLLITANDGSGVDQDIILTPNAAGKVKSAAGFSLTSTTAGYLEGTEQSSSPAAPAANGFRLYAKDNGSGKTVVYIRFATGAEQQIAIEP